MAYQIKNYESFVINGMKGDYLIPAYRQLSIEQTGPLMEVKDDTPTKERAAAAKAFFLGIAPELEAEMLGDVGWLDMFGRYAKEQDLGK